MSKNYAKQLVDQLDEFHTYNNPYDDPLDTWIHFRDARRMVNEGETVECVSAELAGRKKN